MPYTPTTYVSGVVNDVTAAKLNKGETGIQTAQAAAEAAQSTATAAISATLVDAKGDVLAASANDTVGRLAVGTNGHVLTADSAEPLGIKWAAAPGAGGGIAATIVDAKGDLIAATAADAVARLAVGTNGQLLVADSAQTTGLRWSSDLAVIKEAPINVEYPEYGASPSNTAAQNATAIQAAVTALPAAGGTILLPRQYPCDPLTVADRRDIVFQGMGGMSAGAATKSGLTYAGTAARFIDARSSTAFWMKDLQVLYSNAAFTGYLVDYSQSASLTDSALGGTERCFMGGSGVRGATAILRLDKAISMRFRDGFIFGAQTGVIGKEALASYSNSITFDNVTFLSNVLRHVLSPGEGWTMPGCTFEQLITSGGVSAGAGAVYCAYPTKGLAIVGGWCGDATASGTWFDVHGSGITIAGTYIGGGACGVRCDAGITNGLTVAATFDQNTNGAIVDTGGGFAASSSDISFDGSAFLTHAANNKIVWGAYSPNKIGAKTTSYTPTMDDRDRLLTMESASAQVFTIPPNASVPFPIGTTLEFARFGTGTVTITPGAAVTMPNSIEETGTTSRTIASRRTSVVATKVATDIWWLTGSLA